MDKNKLKELFRSDNKKLKTDIVVVLILGALMIVLGNSFFGGNPPGTDAASKSQPKEEESNQAQNTDQRNLEKRLETIFSKVEGAGEIKVMVTTTNGNELILAEETKSENQTTTESGQQGDQRTIENSSTENKVVLLENQDGSTKPLILKEMEPKVEGIVIVAQGGGDVLVKDSLTKAAQALLNVPAHKIEILKMK